MHRVKPWVGAGLLLAAMACQDLAVTNPNAPDRERATEQPVSVESFVSTSFRTWWEVGGHNDYPSWAFSTMANEITSGFSDFGQLELSAEPRSGWNNSQVNSHADVSETPWLGLYGTISTVNDALSKLDSGMVIVTPGRTARALAVGKFMQGISYEYLAFYFDSAAVVDEKTVVDTITTPVYHGYADVSAIAIADLDSAIAVAQQGGMDELPVNSWLFQKLTPAEFVRLANSFAARALAYTPRTRAERDAVDWAEVLRRVDAGITTDFAPVAQPDILWDDWKNLVARIRSGPPSDFGRPSPWVFGPADSTNAFVNWAAAPLSARAGFQVVTADRRIQGPAGPTDPGSYVGYNKSTIFQIARGTYRFSYYYFKRYGTNGTWQTGPQPDMTMSEMNLLKAESLIRLNRAPEAVPLINLSRQAYGNLPPVTVDGPPDVAGCVPRKLSGACGSLWDALRYEKRIEGLGVNGVTAFFDARGWQTLPQYTVVQLPIPGRELGVLRRSVYTYGGPGGSSSAPAPDPERCPVALARCP